MSRRFTAIVAGSLLASVSGVLPVHAATTTVTLACTKAGVTSSASAVMGANQQTHAAASDYTWSSVQDIAITGSRTITQAGTYRLHGTIRNGQLVVDVGGNGVVRLILAGATITSSTAAAIDIKAAPKVVVWLQSGTVNTLTDGTTRATTDTADAALHSKTNLSIAGSGTLRINARFADGIKSSDGLVISGGRISVTSKDDGIRGKHYVYVNGGTISVNSGGDAIRSSGTKASTIGYVYVGGGTVSVTSKQDGLQASSDVIIAKGTVTVSALQDGLKSGCVSYVESARLNISAGMDAVRSDGETVVRSGTINIMKAYQGLQGTSVVISGGSIAMTTSDDGIKVAGASAASTAPPTGTQGSGTNTPAFINSVASHLQIDGGLIVVNALGDGINVNGSAGMSAGRLIVNGPLVSTKAALDVEAEFLVTGGMIIGVGSSAIAMGPATSSAQASILGSFAKQQSAGTILHVVDASGRVLASFKARRAFQSLVYTSPEIVKGQRYQVYTGGSIAGTALGGYSAKGSIAGATPRAVLTAGSYSNPGTATTATPAA